MYRKILVGGVTAAAILGAGTAALATTGSESTSGTPTPSGTSSATHAKAGKNGKAKHSALRRAAHAQITVKTKKGYVTHDLIKGTVTAVSATSITVQAGDKTSETYVVGKDTKVVAKAATPATKGTKRAKPTASSISKVSKGQDVLVAGTGTSTLTAKHIVDLGTK